jgi:hypothetical protein
MPTLKRKTKTQPVIWEGPEGKGPKGGITQSLLSHWLCCRERFRLMVIEGLCPANTFNHKIEYGQMWHKCEEAHAKGAIANWDAPLTDYCRNLCRQYKLQAEQIQHWYNVCKTQFPLYVKYWSKHSKGNNQAPLMQEQTFDVPYSLPSGRVVRLRGKWDSVHLQGKGKNSVVYLQENKTKGDIAEEQLKRQLGFDLQTMIYRIAMDHYPAKEWQEKKIAGVLYNVVRRPLSGGKGSIRKHQPTKNNPAGESDEEFYSRLGEVIMEDPGYYFMRWQVEITQQDIKRFEHEFLHNALEELCNWWHWVDSPAGRKDPFFDPIHWRLPYGIYNPLTEGGSSELDEYLATKSELGLVRTKELFKELV